MVSVGEPNHQYTPQQDLRHVIPSFACQEAKGLVSSGNQIPLADHHVGKVIELVRYLRFLTF